ncbi:hypothetical protein RJT34_02960 [Clitoria ternatea]|uniref:Uncharacterized protein n=1 Tax=Clitoria ternatea TaxID=43366 RepID=A0AAN9Q0S0_CLITE
MSDLTDLPPLPVHLPPSEFLDLVVASAPSSRSSHGAYERLCTRDGDGGSHSYCSSWTDPDGYLFRATLVGRVPENYPRCNLRFDLSQCSRSCSEASYPLAPDSNSMSSFPTEVRPANPYRGVIISPVS